MVDPFIGNRFGVDGHLEVVGVCEKVRGEPLKYLVTCSVCNQKEWFAGETYPASKDVLTKGKLPCHCSGNKRLTEEQQTKRVKKECSSREIRFLGFVGEYKDNYTKLKLWCLKDGHEWSTCSINDFLSNKGRGCPECKARGISLRCGKSEEDAIKGFMDTGSYLEGTHFWKISTITERSRWSYHCPVCSVDEYVQQGLCSGVFTAGGGDLTKGKISCRCSPQHEFTQEQRIYQINKKIEEEHLPYKLLGWKTHWKGSRTCAQICCEEHGDFFPTLNDFVNKGSRCPSCSHGGFSPAQNAYLYVIKVEGESPFTGYGITRNMEQRMSTHRTYIKRAGNCISEIRTFDMTGREAMAVENLIKTNFEMCPQVVKGFKTEATHSHLYPDVLAFVQSHINQH